MPPGPTLPFGGSRKGEGFANFNTFHARKVGETSVGSLNRVTNENADTHPIAYGNNEYISAGATYSEDLVKKEVPFETFRSHSNYAKKLKETYTNSKRIADAMYDGTTEVLDRYEIDPNVKGGFIYAGGDKV
jgi:hypothetical protein